MRNESMFRRMSPRMHGYLDYGAVMVFAVAPTIFGWNSVARNASYIFGAIHLVLSLLTAYPLGLKRIIPFTIHATVEFMTALLLVVFPWVARFSDVPAARNFYMAMGLGLIALWTVTDYKLSERNPEFVPTRLRKLMGSIGR